MYAQKLPKNCCSIYILGSNDKSRYWRTEAPIEHVSKICVTMTTSIKLLGSAWYFKETVN